MIPFIALIAALCSQPGPSPDVPHKHAETREQAFAAQTDCIKRLFKACTEKHMLKNVPVPKDNAGVCLVENL